MTDADAQALDDLNDLDLRHYALQKRYHYFKNKLAKNPKDIEAYARVARSLATMGYMKGDEYLASYVKDGLVYVDKGMTAAGPTFNALLYSTKARLNIFLGKLSEATAAFATIVQKDPKSFETAMVGYQLNKALKKPADAEKWIAFAIGVASTPAQKTLARRYMGYALSNEGRHQEALVYYNESLKAPDASPWDWHNAALEYCELKDLDKCIEYEKHALKISEFGAAKHQLAGALVQKADVLMQKVSYYQGKSTDQPAEQLYLEALKWDSGNIEAMLGMALLLSGRHAAMNSPSEYEKAKTYLQQAIATKPTDGHVMLVAQIVETNKVSHAPTQAARTPSSEVRK
jgi:tetratricopeptide (TPR) repeat protein